MEWQHQLGQSISRATSMWLISLLSLVESGAVYSVSLSPQTGGDGVSLACLLCSNVSRHNAELMIGKPLEPGQTTPITAILVSLPLCTDCASKWVKSLTEGEESAKRRRLSRG